MEGKVKGWIEKTGHALEMRTARTLREAGFDSVIQAEYYIDDLTKQYRESDVVAYRVLTVGSKQVFVALVFECKETKEKPWVVFTRDQNLPPDLPVTERA